MKCINEEIPFEIPKGWEWCRVSQIIFPPKYGTSSKSQSSGNVPVLRMGNIQDGEIDYTKLVYSNNLSDNEKYKLQKGDLLFNRTNSAELVGKTALYRGEQEVIFAGYLILLRPIFVNSEYVNYLFSSQYVRSYCKDVKTIGVQQCNINAEKISTLLIPIAPPKEQIRIVAKIRNLQPHIAKYGKSQEKLDNLNSEISSIFKKSILQEAVQGKLVPQIESEGTAAGLLEQIRQEKQRLVKEGKLKKSALVDSVIYKGDDNKYFEKIGKETICIADEIPFEIPATWSWCRFGDIVITLTGKTPERGNQQYWSNGVYNWISIADMVSGSVVNTTKEKISKVAAGKCFGSISPKGSLIMSFKLTVGRTSVLGIDAYHNEAIVTIYPFVDASNAFRNYLLNVMPVIANTGNSKDAIKGKTLNSKSIANLLFPLPPIAEQRRIVDKIEELASIMSR